jgi:hypothetical protein
MSLSAIYRVNHRKKVVFSDIRHISSVWKCFHTDTDFNTDLRSIVDYYKERKMKYIWMVTMLLHNSILQVHVNVERL